MAEVLILQSKGYWNSMGSTLHDAAELKGLGVDVAVVFMEEAVAALAEKKFDMSPPLAKYRATIEENLKKMGLSTNIMDYLKQAKSAGIPLYAAGWCDLLGVRGKLPAEIQEVQIPDVIKLMAEAKKIIG
jgi:predicted peroxiredoxin